MTAQSEFKKAIKLLKKGIKATGGAYRVTSTTRTAAEQETLANSGNPYPVAAPGRSQHQFGLAVDMVVQPAEILSYWALEWTAAGFGWDSDDPVHFAYFTRAEWNQILGQVSQGQGTQYQGYATGFAPGGGGSTMPAPAPIVPPSLSQTGYIRQPPLVTTSPAVGGSTSSIATRGIAALTTPTSVQPTLAGVAVASIAQRSTTPTLIGSRDYSLISPTQVSTSTSISTRSLTPTTTTTSRTTRRL